jgi:hypothetical protein
MGDPAKVSYAATQWHGLGRGESGNLSSAVHRVESQATYFRFPCRVLVPVDITKRVVEAAGTAEMGLRGIAACS